MPPLVERSQDWCIVYFVASSHDKLRRNMRCPTMWYVRPAIPQISMYKRTVWCEPLLVVWIFYGCKATDWTSFWVEASQARLRLHMSRCHTFGNHMCRNTRKPVFGVLRTTDMQTTSLHIRADWSAFSLFTFWKVSYVNLLHVKCQFSS